MEHDGATRYSALQSCVCVWGGLRKLNGCSEDFYFRHDLSLHFHFFSLSVSCGPSHPLHPIRSSSITKGILDLLPWQQLVILNVSYVWEDTSRSVVMKGLGIFCSFSTLYEQLKNPTPLGIKFAPPRNNSGVDILNVLLGCF